MKKQLIRALTLLIFSSVLLSSCSMQYRERHRRVHDEHHDDHHDDHHYDRY